MDCDHWAVGLKGPFQKGEGNYFHKFHTVASQYKSTLSITIVPSVQSHFLNADPSRLDLFALDKPARDSQGF
uniref:Uncharacterized protein n=1 Tax=Anguilla anguilla TaxID=7936 RepID=A0A0E9WP19_ANGAN